MQTSTATHPNPPPRIAPERIEALAVGLRGQVLQPHTPGYDEARSIWNAMIDRHPALIVQPRGAADVMAAVVFARDQGLELAVKGGGHNVAGSAVCDGGLMLDLSAMTSVRVDPVARTARVEPGALLRDLDRETQAHGLATPAGFISSTGVAGLTLGGGFGYLSRRFGLTADNLRSVDLVTAGGKLVQASTDRNPDLFWGLRGGGNFGVATAFEFDLHGFGPQVLAGPVVHTFEDAPDVLHRVAEIMCTAPDTVACLPVIRHAPPAPFIPEAYHGRLILLLALIHTGDPTDSEAALAPLRVLGRPIADAVSTKPYTAFQSMFDASAVAGARNYWKGHYLHALSAGGIDVLCAHAARMTSKESVIGMLSLGGAIARRPADASPYPHRDAAWVLNIQSRWREAAEDAQHIAWARGLFQAMAPFTTGGLYVNFISGDEGEARVRAAYGETIHRRLATLKADWDPDNVFHLNQNIRPDVSV
ncbi:MAG: FAD-binding oxidoreductase [Candidatus Competibacterales bacterium]|nr:FAD-binding oxidoreductase [Candidatus Competibacterales bacterium]